VADNRKAHLRTLLRFRSEEEDQDIAQAHALLSGYIVPDEKGRPKEVRYLAPAQETEARKALARLILSGMMPFDLARTLAALIAPASSKAARVEFVRPHVSQRGRNHLRRTAIAVYLAQRVKQDPKKRGALERAIDNAVEEFGLQPRHLMSIWRDYKWARDRGLHD
jgi:hypothetical protein